MKSGNIIYGVKQTVETIKDTLFPKSCPMCDKLLDRGMLVCRKCESRLVYIGEPRCKKCGKQLDNDRIEYCMDCSAKKHYYKSGIAAFLYNDMISHSIYRFKYHNRRTYAEFYGKAIADKYGKNIRYWGAEVIIPVPVHKKKLIKRGYNQAGLIAVELGKQLHIKVDEDYLIRVVNTRPQKEMDKSARKKNVEKAFKINNNIVKYKKIILVDDIYTTGSTIDACAKALLDAGAETVNFISLSIGEGI